MFLFLFLSWRFAIHRFNRSNFFVNELQWYPGDGRVLPLEEALKLVSRFVLQEMRLRRALVTGSTFAETASHGESTPLDPQLSVSPAMPSRLPSMTFSDSAKRRRTAASVESRELP